MWVQEGYRAKTNTCEAVRHSHILQAVGLAGNLQGDRRYFLSLTQLNDRLGGVASSRGHRLGVHALHQL